MLWDPAIVQIRAIVKRINSDSSDKITVQKLSGDELKDVIPKRVKLSDAAIVIAILMDIPNDRLKAHYPLDFTAQGTILKSPARTSVGFGVAYNNKLLTYQNYRLAGSHPHKDLQPFQPIDRPGRRSQAKSNTVHKFEDLLSLHMTSMVQKLRKTNNYSAHLTPTSQELELEKNRKGRKWQLMMTGKDVSDSFTETSSFGLQDSDSMIDDKPGPAADPRKESSLLSIDSLTKPLSSCASVTDSVGGGRSERSARKRFRLFGELEQDTTKPLTEQDIKHLQDRIVLLESQLRDKSTLANEFAQKYMAVTASAELFHDASEQGTDALGDTQDAIDDILQRAACTDEQRKVLEDFNLNITNCETLMEEIVAEGRTHLRVLKQTAVEYHVITHGGSHNDAMKARFNEFAAIWAGKDSGGEDPAAYLHQKDMDLED